MRLVDSHCHLHLPPLDAEPEAVLRRAAEAGVTRVLAAATDRGSWDALARMAGLPGVAVALGLHPWCAGSGPIGAALETALEGACAVGEIGLDFHAPKASKEIQLALFEEQLGLALRLDLPVVLHCRGAYPDLIARLAACRPRLRGVVHGFTRPPELARRLLDLGLHLGFGAALTRKQANAAAASAAYAPLDRSLLAPDAPSGRRGRPPNCTEPSALPEVALALARIRGQDLDVLAEETTRNARALFALA